MPQRRVAAVVEEVREGDKVERQMMVGFTALFLYIHTAGNAHVSIW